MTSPLAPTLDASLNCTTPSTARRYDKYEVEALTTVSKATDNGSDTQNSSPFVANVSEMVNFEQENTSPLKRHSRVISGTELSPLKILSAQRKTSSGSSTSESMGPPPSIRSPRKSSPEKRFPVKISAPDDVAKSQTQTQPRTMHLDDVVRENRGLKRAIDIFEDEQDDGESRPAPKHHQESSTGTLNMDVVHESDDEVAGPDDTLASTFSTFSAVPSMTMFSKLGQSPTRLSGLGSLGTKPRLNHQHSSSARESPVNDPDESGNPTNLLMDFTEQLRHQSRSPGKRATMSPSRTTPIVRATPNRHHTNLIDFDIPPMPTPRSIPTISARELESLKSNFLSEISSLKASLSGKEAEVQSLKTAVGDAEKRVGESMEQLREERLSKEQLADEKESWEKRNGEMESVLRKVKDEMASSQKEREEMEQKLDESEKRREVAEVLHQEAESKIAGMRAGKDNDGSSPEKTKGSGTENGTGASASNRDVEVAVERVARELHALYKSKHETKVAALKKSYESRWEKKTRELETRVEELVRENDKLQAGCDTTLARIDMGNAETEERKARAVKDSAAIKELHADVQRLEAVVTTVKKDNEELRGMLEKERVEKGELVQLAEEMMSMQSFVGSQQQQQQQQQQQKQRQQPQQQTQSRPSSQQPERHDPAKTPRASMDNRRGSMNRNSGLKAPSSALRAPRASAGGLPRPGSMARSGIMSSIEKMGSYRGRAAE